MFTRRFPSGFRKTNHPAANWLPGGLCLIIIYINTAIAVDTVPGEGVNFMTIEYPGNVISVWRILFEFVNNAAGMYRAMDIHAYFGSN